MAKKVSDRIAERIEHTVVQELVSTARGVQFLLDGLGERTRCPTLPAIARGMIESLRLATDQVEAQFLRYHAGPRSDQRKQFQRRQPRTRSKRPGPVLLMPPRTSASASARTGERP
jgi:hypothetical protein